MPNAGIMSIYQPTAGLTREGGKGPFSTLLLPQSLFIVSVLLHHFRPFLNHINPLNANTNQIHMLKDSFSAYKFPILPLFLLNAWGIFNISMSEAGAARWHQTSSAWVASQSACQACFEEPLLWKNVVQRGLCLTGWRSPAACGSGQPHSSLRCVSEAGRSQAVPSKLSFPQLHLKVLGLLSPWIRQLQGPHSAAAAKGRCLQPSHHLCGFVLPFECPLNLLSHTPNSSHVHSPLQNKRFEMKVQPCSNNHINYLFRWGKPWVKSRFSDMEELLVSTANIIFPTGLVFHKVTWPKGVCTREQVWLKTKAAT